VFFEERGTFLQRLVRIVVTAIDFGPMQDLYFFTIAWGKFGNRHDEGCSSSFHRGNQNRIGHGIRLDSFPVSCLGKKESVCGTVEINLSPAVDFVDLMAIRISAL
jgi:hypothetical protein